MTKVLITGGAGFVGSNLARLCLERGYSVRVLDNLTTGRASNVEGLNVELMQGDITDPPTLEKAVEGCTFVFCEGAVSMSASFYPHIQEGIRVNELGFANLMRAAVENGVVRKVVYAMSARMYARSPVPSREDELRVEDVTDVYSSSLLNRLYIARHYELTHRIRSVGLVYFSVYGPNLAGKGQGANIVQKAIWELRAGKSPIFFGDGTLTRDLVHVRDVCEANLLAAEGYYSSGFVNVGTGVETSMNDLGKRLNLIMKTSNPPAYEDPPYAYSMRQCADTTKAQRVLGFRARIPLGQGLKALTLP